MRIFGNRIVISLIVIAVMTTLWEFVVKPVSGPLYTAAVNEYRARNYKRSLELLEQAYRIDPNSAAVLALMGWNYLKLGQPAQAEDPYFRRAYMLAPDEPDIALGYAYTQVELGKVDEAFRILNQLRERGVADADVHVAQGALYRQLGRNREAAREFQLALAADTSNPAAEQNLREIYATTGDLAGLTGERRPFVRPEILTHTFRARGEAFEYLSGDEWKTTYLAGVSLTNAIPGRYPAESRVERAMYRQWLTQISGLGANAVRVSVLLPPAFYAALKEHNSSGASPLFLVQGVSLGEPPQMDLLDPEFIRASQNEIRFVLDALHGQGDVPWRPGRTGGIYDDSVAEWTAGLVIGDTWLPHLVIATNQRHPESGSFNGTYFQVASGSATEVFLARLLDFAAEYEEKTYNWQRPLAFLTWPSLDPMRHPTESTILEEVAIRRARGERVPVPSGPYDDDDSVSVDPLRLQPKPRLAAGYFAAYSVFPSYPDFLNYQPNYQAVRDSQGTNPFLGYLRDLKANHRGIPLLVADYGIPSSHGIGHMSPAGFHEGGHTERRQGELLARLTRSVHEAGAAGGLIYEWLDQWFRQSWQVRRFEVPEERSPRWLNVLDPAEQFGLVAAEPASRSTLALRGLPEDFEGKPPLYASRSSGPAKPAEDPFDPARHLKALYADADEGFLYLRLEVGRLDNNGDGQPDWNQAQYVIGLSTLPGRAGLQNLPFIAPVVFPMGMTYAVQLGGPDEARVLVASTYTPFRIDPIEGIRGQTGMRLLLGWQAALAGEGEFEPQMAEPNRRRYGRDGRYFPPLRYERGLLQFGSLDPQSPSYNSLAGWNVNLTTNTIDVRIPWGLLGVTDPSTFRVMTAVREDGSVETAETPGFLMAVFSYRPADAARQRPPMEQHHAIADSLPALSAAQMRVDAASLRSYRWTGWDQPQYKMRPKESWAVLRKAFQALPSAPAGAPPPTTRTAQGRNAAAGRAGR